MPLKPTGRARTSFSSQESEVAGVPFSEFSATITAPLPRPARLRRHIIIKQALRTLYRRCCTLTAFYRAVCGKVFDAGHHRVAICRAFTLHRFHQVLPIVEVRYVSSPKPSEARPQRGSRETIDHRCPGHIQAIICRFISRDTSDRFHCIEVKRRGQTEG